MHTPPDPKKWATLALLAVRGPHTRNEDPVAWADAMTSRHDLRTALCIASGVALEHICAVTGHNNTKSGGCPSCRRPGPHHRPARTRPTPIHVTLPATTPDEVEPEPGEIPAGYEVAAPADLRPGDTVRMPRTIHDGVVRQWVREPVTVAGVRLNANGTAVVIYPHSQNRGNDCTLLLPTWQPYGVLRRTATP